MWLFNRACVYFVLGCFHRDMKLSNILLGISLTCRHYITKLTDFGSARLDTEDSTLTDSVGTRLFMSPEVNFTIRQTISNYNIILTKKLIRSFGWSAWVTR